VRYVIGLVALLVLSCGEKKSSDQLIPYYNISSQLRRDIKTMYSENAYVIKYNVYNGKPEQVINRKPDWNKEFDPLFEADIHQPALLGYYTADTVLHDDSTISISYTTQHDDLEVQKLTVHLDRNGELEAFNAMLQSNSMLTNTIREIEYERFRFYNYKVTEHNKYSSPDTYSVKGEIYLKQEYFQ
jgi:hypothetical protein